jgi:hypothetical protein
MQALERSAVDQAHTVRKARENKSVSQSRSKRDYGSLTLLGRQNGGEGVAVILEQSRVLGSEPQQAVTVHGEIQYPGVILDTWDWERTEGESIETDQPGLCTNPQIPIRRLCEACYSPSREFRRFRPAACKVASENSVCLCEKGFIHKAK